MTKCDEHSELVKASGKIDLLYDDVKYIRRRMDKLTWTVAKTSALTAIVVSVIMMFIGKQIF